MTGRKYSLSMLSQILHFRRDWWQYTSSTLLTLIRWQRWQRPWKRWCQTAQKDSQRQHPRYHKTSHQTSCTKRWRQAYLCHDLRRNKRCSQVIPWVCHSRCCHIYWARKEKDCHIPRCCLCFEETRSNTVWIRWLNNMNLTATTWYSVSFAITVLSIKRQRLSVSSWLCFTTRALQGGGCRGWIMPTSSK